MPKILVIEDISSLREEIIEVLSLEGFEVIGAADGKQGIEIATAELPDLVICDVSMPVMDGYSTLAAMQEHDSTATIPFIFLTAYNDPTQVRKGMNLGADDYLTKPFAVHDLIAIVTARLKKKSYIDQKLKSEVDTIRTNISRALPHELRTPLNGIMGFSELLAEELQDQPDLKEMADGIYESAQILYRVIQNFLLYAELEILANKKTIITDQSTYAQEVIANSSRLKAQTAGRLADLHLHLTDAKVRISKIRLSKIIEEIMDNCLKFSNPETAIEVISTCDRDSMFITFTDYGRGMTPTQINNIAAYIQFNRKVYEQQGTGLGLAIAKILVKLYGGDMQIYSDLGVKTTVTVTLPLAETSQVIAEKHY
ncbi:histidine kinase,Response regulator receiver domain protein,histidine kinase [Synechococcus sp. PCC 7502]|uniref:hybrid sensor histidine kinase/response regulator n=1 Tax=Synechococcus sp. PCC 7502 TaxID=1173263 RepID=UPI00029FC0E0|nr:response regulator [Synechococcus sp. PCC 7502]AFY74446.1 histidine kinase,Response regulator receiver domain protein,histidine kinase [Synechococcus sp. PCC 7502]